MSENPAWTALMAVAGAYLFYLWLGDLRDARAGTPNPKAFPGALTCDLPPVVLAVAGSLLLLALETGGEAMLGISDQQKTITVLFGAYTLVAAFVEELVFRGYLVVRNRGQHVLWGSIFAFSLLFALLHPFLWEWSEGRLLFHFGTKGWFSTGIVFLCSLWFYALRFLPSNPRHSLIPCIAAHFAKNLGVFAIKAASGFVHGWF